MKSFWTFSEPIHQSVIHFVWPSTHNIMAYNQSNNLIHSCLYFMWLQSENLSLSILSHAHHDNQYAHTHSHPILELLWKLQQKIRSIEKKKCNMAEWICWGFSMKVIKYFVCLKPKLVERQSEKWFQFNCFHMLSANKSHANKYCVCPPVFWSVFQEKIFDILTLRVRKKEIRRKKFSVSHTREGKMYTNHHSETSFNQYKCTKNWKRHGEKLRFVCHTHSDHISPKFGWPTKQFIPSNNIFTIEQKCLF